MCKDIEIRNIEIEDINDVTEFISKMYKDTNNLSVTQMYDNINLVQARFAQKIERGCIALIKDQIIGIFTLLSPTMDNYWTVGILNVENTYRRKRIATSMQQHVEKDLLSYYNKIKISSTIKKNNKEGLLFLVMNDYQFEGNVRGLTNEKDIYIVGKTL